METFNLHKKYSWLIILFITYQTMLTWKTKDDLMKSKNLYKNVEFFLQIFQTAALLEVLHAAIGLVRSNPVLVFLQVLSRILVVWLVMFVFEPVNIILKTFRFSFLILKTWNDTFFVFKSRASVGVFICCAAWSFAEIVRYLYYALNILERIPYFLTWCRWVNLFVGFRFLSV